MDSRRKFIEQSSIVLGAGMVSEVIPKPILRAARQFFAPSDQVNVAAIGINGMGWSDTLAALKVSGVNIVALCDVDKNVLNRRKKELSQLTGSTKEVDCYGDYRKVLERKDVDAVIIGTPDHWHALIMIEACMAGKDVYVEKPVGNSIGEARAMVAAKNKYSRIVQGGQWQRSQQHFKDAVDFVATGQLGNIRTVKVWCYQGWMKPQPIVPDTEPPEAVDYRQWLGPAPNRPFNASRFHFHFRWFWDYAGGLMTDWGVHLLDYGLMGMKADVPQTISALGGKFAYPDLYEETPDTLTSLYQFEHFNLVWDHAMGIDNGSYGRDHGIAYIGDNATLVLNRNGWEVLEEKQSKNKVVKPLADSVDNGVELHWVNFIGAVRSRKEKMLNCPIEAGAHVATIAQMGNIAFRSGQKLNWDKEVGRFTDDEVNAKYLMKEYHNGFKLPSI